MKKKMCSLSKMFKVIGKVIRRKGIVVEYFIPSGKYKEGVELKTHVDLRDD